MKIQLSSGLGPKECRLAVAKLFDSLSKEYKDIKFISSLETIDKMNFDFIIPSHGTRFDNKLVKENLSYLKQLESNSISEDYCKKKHITSEFYLEAHRQNMEYVINSEIK